MAAIANERDKLLQAAAVRFTTPSLVGTVDFASQVTGAEKPANNATVGATWGVNIGSQPTNLSGINASEGSKLAGIAAGADVTTSILASSGTSVVMTSSALFKTTTGLGGVFIGAGGLLGKDTSGNLTFSINATTGAATFNGTISGGSLNIDGTATITGNTYSADVGDYSALVVNEGGARRWGVSGLGGVNGAGVYGIGYYGHGVQGSASASGKYGVYGIAKAGSSAEAGVYGWSGLPTKAGVHAENSSGTGVGLKITGQMLWGASQWASPSGTGLLAADGSWVAQSTFLAAAATAAAAAQISNSGHTYTFSGGSVSGAATATFSGANKPGANSANIWLAFVIDGTTYYLPAWPA